MNSNWFNSKKNRKLMLIGFILTLTFICSIDFWDWNSAILGFLNFPMWIWYILILTLLLSVTYYFIITFIWRDSTQ